MDKPPIPPWSELRRNRQVISDRACSESFQAMEGNTSVLLQPETSSYSNSNSRKFKEILSPQFRVEPKVYNPALMTPRNGSYPHNFSVKNTAATPSESANPEYSAYFTVLLPPCPTLPDDEQVPVKNIDPYGCSSLISSLNNNEGDINQEPYAEPKNPSSTFREKLERRKYQALSITKPSLKPRINRRGFLSKARRFFTPRLKHLESDRALPEQWENPFSLSLRPNQSWSPPRRPLQPLPRRGVSEPIYYRYSSESSSSESSENTEHRLRVAGSSSPSDPQFQGPLSYITPELGKRDNWTIFNNTPQSQQERTNNSFLVVSSRPQLHEVERDFYTISDKRQDQRRSTYTLERKSSRFQQASFQPRDPSHLHHSSKQDTRKRLSIGPQTLLETPVRNSDNLADKYTASTSQVWKQSFDDVEKQIETYLPELRRKYSLESLFEDDPKGERYFPGNSGAVRVSWEDFASGKRVESEQSRSRASSLYSLGPTSSTDCLETPADCCNKSGCSEVRPLNIRKLSDPGISSPSPQKASCRPLPSLPSHFENQSAQLQDIPPLQVRKNSLPIAGSRPPGTGLPQQPGSEPVRSLRTRDRYKSRKKQVVTIDKASQEGGALFLLESLDQSFAEPNDLRSLFFKGPKKGVANSGFDKRGDILPGRNASVTTNTRSESETGDWDKPDIKTTTCPNTPRQSSNGVTTKAFKSGHPSVTSKLVCERVRELTAASRNPFPEREGLFSRIPEPISITTDKRFSQLLSKWEQGHLLTGTGQSGSAHRHGLKQGTVLKKTKSVRFQAEATQECQSGKQEFEPSNNSFESVDDHEPVRESSDSVLNPKHPLFIELRREYELQPRTPHSLSATSSFSSFYSQSLDGSPCHRDSGTSNNTAGRLSLRRSKMDMLQIKPVEFNQIKGKAIEDARQMQASVIEAATKSGKEPPKYALLELIGKGTFGRVYKGKDMTSAAIVAVKIIDIDESDTLNPRNADSYSEFLKEVNALKLLSENQARNINHVIEALPVGKAMWMITEYCGGGSVATLMKPTAPGGLQEKWIIPILREVAEAIKWVHQAGIIHRDIKCANVLITEQGGVQLCDFGVAGTIETKLDKRSTIIGTPHWMAPELFDPNPSYGKEVDIWAFGSMIYEIATGLPPNVAKGIISYDRIGPYLKQHVPRLEGGNYSNELRGLVAFCLEEQPSARPSVEQVQKHPYIYNTSQRYPTSSLTQLVKAFKAWEDHGGARKSLFMIGGAPAMSEAIPNIPFDDGWNFSTTAAFDKEVYNVNAQDVYDVYGNNIELDAKFTQETSRPNPPKASRRRPPPEALAPLRAPLEKIFDPNTLSSYEENSRSHYGRPGPLPASDLPLRDDSAQTSIRDTMIDLGDHDPATGLSSFADMDTIRPERHDRDDNIQDNSSVQDFSRPPLSDPADVANNRKTQDWKFPTMVPPASADPEMSRFPSSYEPFQPPAMPGFGGSRPILTHHPTESAPGNFGNVPLIQGSSTRPDSMASMIDLDAALGPAPSIRPSTASSDVGSTTSEHTTSGNPFEFERHASMYQPVSTDQTEPYQSLDPDAPSHFPTTDGLNNLHDGSDFSASEAEGPGGTYTNGYGNTTQYDAQDLEYTAVKPPSRMAQSTIPATQSYTFDHFPPLETPPSSAVMSNRATKEEFQDEMTRMLNGMDGQLRAFRSVYENIPVTRAATYRNDRRDEDGTT
ncbi:hypothetical protein B7463_g271, partial [Scytalidium lignicola]